MKIQVAKIIAGADERFLAKWWLNLLIIMKKVGNKNKCGWWWKYCQIGSGLIL